MAVDEKVFQAALEAIDQGDRQRARDLLTRLIKAQPGNVEYWLWMSAVVDTARERVYCLKEALRLDPENPTARRGLALSGEMEVDEKLVIPPELQYRDWQVNLDKGPSLQDTGLPISRRQFVLAGGSAVLLLALVVFVILVSRPQKQTVQTILRRTATASQTAIPVSTLLSKEEASGSPTPLWMFLPATYTPTAMYVNTPHPRTEAYRTALRSMQRGDYPSMLTYLDQAITVQPDAVDLYYYKGEAYRLMGDLNQAQKYYQQALVLQPDFAPAYAGMARAAMTSNRMADAQKYLQKALSIDPEYAEMHLELAALDLKENNAGAALENLEQVAAAMPDSTLLHYYHAQALYMQGDPYAALEEAQIAQKLDITFLPAYRLIGQAALAANEPPVAIEALHTYTRYEPADSQALAWLGAAYEGEGQIDLAFEVFSQAIDANGPSAEAYLQRGLLLLKQNQVTQAIEDLNRAVKIEKSFSGFITLGKAYLAKGDDRSAYVQFANAEGYAQNDYQKAEMLYFRAQSLQSIGESKAAIRDWKALLNMPAESLSTGWEDAAKEALVVLISPTPSLVPPTATFTCQPTRTATVTRTRQASVTQTNRPAVTITPSLTVKP